METQLLVLFSVGTLLVLNGLLGRTSLIDSDSSEEAAAVVEPESAGQDDDTASASDVDTVAPAKAA